jgi:hypothetical protein
MSLEDTFTEVYRNGLWKYEDSPQSGIGAGTAFIKPYVATLAPLLAGKNVVDIGFGDFTVAKCLLRDVKFATYTGMEIVPEMVEAAKAYEGPFVRVMQGNILDVDPPVGEICLIRQVLQHLSNAAVRQIVDKLLSAYPVVIASDQIRGRRNTDMESGMGIRKFGLFLEKPPFDYAVEELVTVNYNRYTVSTVKLGLG